MEARTSRYHDVYAHWQRDPEGFWGEAANEIDWIEKPKKVFDPKAGIYGRWFAGGVCNTCYNARDRHVLKGRNEQAAQLAEHIAIDGRETGNRWAVGMMDVLLANVRLWAGRMNESIAHGEDAIALLRG